MGFARLLILLGVVGFTYHWWSGQHPEEVFAAQHETSPNGFVPATMPAGAAGNAIVIFAPQNCPSDRAQRADALAEQLRNRRIPVVRSSSYSASSAAPSPDERANLNRTLEVLNAQAPAVFVNGMAKANPSLDEVVAEYERTR